jgi:hypothetical protein
MDIDDIAYLFMVLFFAMLLGVITGAIAQKKGDSFIAWWLFGTFLFIIALPMVLLMDAKAGGRNLGTKHCPYCNAAIKTSVMKCPECHRSQPNIGAATSESWQRARVAGDDVEKWAKEHGIDKDEPAA